MLNLAISNTMSSKESIENNLIRISDSIRTKCNLSLGDIINIKNVILQVDKIYINDFINNIENAYITQHTFQKFKKPNVPFEITKHVTLGCDPEFFLVDTKNNVLYNPAFITSKYLDIGYDGMLMELRPAPSLSPEKVVLNLFNLIKRIKLYLITHNLNNLEMIAQSGGWNNFAGFHIHLGLPKKLLNPNFPDFGKILKIIIKVLDYYIGTLCVIVEKDDNTRRCNPYVNYGKVSDYRNSINTLEYRVPGGALLKHPGLTKGLLGISSMLVHDILERISIYTNNYKNRILEDEDIFLKKIYYNILSTKDMYQVICVPTIENAEKEAIKILNDFKYMTNYLYYKDIINNFISLSYMNLSNNIWYNWKQLMEFK